MQLAHAALRERLSYYRGGFGGYRSYIRLEELLMDLLWGMTGDGPLSQEAAEKAVAYLDEMRSKIAMQPRRLEPGCRFCRRQCAYGFMVQRDLQSKAKALAARLKNAAEQPGFVNNFKKLVDVVQSFSQDVTPFAVSPQHLHPLAFCYLVNSGAQRPYVLQGFQQVADSSAKSK